MYWCKIPICTILNSSNTNNSPSLFNQPVSTWRLKSPDNVVRSLLSANFPFSTLDVQEVSVAPSAVGYRLDDTGFNSQQGQEIFSLPKIHSNSSVQPASTQWAPGALSREVIQPESDDDHSHTPSCKVKRREAVPLLLLHAFMVWTGTTLPGIFYSWHTGMSHFQHTNQP